MEKLYRYRFASEFDKDRAFRHDTLSLHNENSSLHIAAALH